MKEKTADGIGNGVTNLLIVSKKHHGIQVIDCWYAEHALRQNGIIRYQEACKPLGKQVTEFRTLISDLTEDEDQILSHFSKNCRYEVRRAERENVVCTTVFGKNITQEEIDRFADFFGDFWESKGIPYTEKEKCRAQIRQYADAGAFALTKACVDGKILVYHTYIVGDNRVRLYQSASQFRTDDTVSTNLIGYANRYLHYQDMLWFKSQKKESYDWGGAGMNEDVESITKFKESFGGTPAVYYNGEETRGILPGAYKRLTGFAGKLMK